MDKTFANSFDANVMRIIKDCSYEFFLIKQDFNVKCTCLEEGTTQADPTCPKCLGTGFKIRIHKVSGASVNSNAPTTVKAGLKLLVAKNYYIPANNFILQQDNIIVDDDEVSFVYQNIIYKSFNGKDTYQKSVTLMKKLDTPAFMINFNKIIGR
jgi:hypothetical protein